MSYAIIGFGRSATHLLRRLPAAASKYPLQPDARILGVVSKFRIEHETVLDRNGEATEFTIPYNSGFLIGYGINHALDLIGQRRG